MVGKWSHDPQYSHAYLVPVFSTFLLWLRRRELSAAGGGPCWWGLVLLLPGAALRLVGTYSYFEWLEAVSLLPVLAGAVLLLYGKSVLRWSWPAIAFVFFMVPLPYRIETGLARPLQRIATVAATYALQTLGRPALSEGNVIIVNEARIGVVEACNGLGMLLVFFALTTGLVMLVRRSPLDKLLLLLSTAPIAVLVNVLRITLTGVLYETAGSRWADLVFHELAGWLMMPMALGLLCFELHILSRLFVEAVPFRQVPAVTRERTELPSPRPLRKQSNQKDATEEHPEEVPLLVSRL
jgi:exosortase